MNAEYTEHVYFEYHGKSYEPIQQREEIVRCGDCGCFEENTSLCNRLGKFPEWHACTEPDGFCKWAEPKSSLH